MTLNFRVLDSKKKVDILKQLNDTYGLDNDVLVNGSMLISGKDKIRLLNSDINMEVVNSLNDNVRLEFMGLYICKLEKDGVRLSHDASSLFKDDITKNIVIVNDSQSKEWLMGHEVLLDDFQIKDLEALGVKKGFVVLKDHDDMIIGCGKFSNNRITNFVPKTRRLKK